MRAIIFDMDGVLIDSEYAYTAAIKEIMLNQGYEVSENYVYSFIGTTHEFTWSQIVKDYNLKSDINTFIDDMLDRRNEIVRNDGIILYPNVREFIIENFKKGYKLAVASSSPRDEILRTVRELDVAEYFECLISGEEVENSKPAPEIFLKASELINIPPQECIVIEDSENGVIAAKRAGMYCIGYLDNKYPEQNLSLADITVDDFRNINLSIIQKGEE